MRTRTIKPDFFKDEDLIALPFEWRLLFQGLWLLADKDGRLEDKPLRIKYEIFPGDEIDVEQGLEILAQPKKVNSNCDTFIIRYEVDGRRYIQITNFKKHQNPHPHEKSSVYPQGPDLPCNVITSNVMVSKSDLASNKNKNKNKDKDKKKKDKEVPTDSEFDLFWKAYPRKIGKADARKAWERLKPPLDIVLATIEKAKQSREWREKSGQFIPHPATWLNAGRWEDEYDIGDENVTRIPIKAEPAPDEQVTKLRLPTPGKASP